MYFPWSINSTNYKYVHLMLFKTYFLDTHLMYKKMFRFNVILSCLCHVCCRPLSDLGVLADQSSASSADPAATEAYERHIKILEREKAELANKLGEIFCITRPTICQLNYVILISTHLKLCLTSPTHNF